MNSTSETIRSIWPFLWLTRILGLSPICRTGNSLQVKTVFHISWFPTWIALGVRFLVLLNNIYRWINGNTDLTLSVQAINSLAYFSHSFINTAYMAWSVKKLANIINSCIELETMLNRYRSEDDYPLKSTKVVFYSQAVFSCYMILWFIGLCLFYTAFGFSSNVQTVQEFFVFFNSVIGIPGFDNIYFILQLICDFGWFYADLFQAIISVIFTNFCKRFNKILDSRMDFNVSEIEQFTREHQHIFNIVSDYNYEFSTLIFISYLHNTGYLFARLYLGVEQNISPSSHLTEKVEAFYTSFMCAFKILFPTYLAAKLHEESHLSNAILKNWNFAIDPIDSTFKLIVIGKFMSQISTQEIGLSCCEYFVISKIFLVKIISVFITYEIIILQFQACRLKLS